MAPAPASPAPATVSRDRLLAILAADGVGYSRLIGLDPHGTVTALDAARSIFKTRIETHGGRVIDMAGDSVLAVFESALAAVQAACEIQAELARRTASVSSAAKLLFRIGIHVGDVIEKADGSVYGDGVNVAARLEGLAEPGGIVVSQDVYGMVRRRVAAGFDDLGPQDVKNIEHPVHAFRMCEASSQFKRKRAMWSFPRPPMTRRAAIAALAAIVVAAAATWLVPKVRHRGSAAHSDLSIVVLPFRNLTGDAQQAYIADGLTVSITNDLARLPDASVIDIGTAQTLAARALTAQQLGQDLSVRFILQGSVQRTESSLRVVAQLSEAATNAQLWSQTFDDATSDLFALQDKVAALIGSSLGRDLMVRAARDSERKVSPTVADLLLRARARKLRPRSLQNYQEQESLYRQALAMEPEQVDCLLELADVVLLQSINYGTRLTNENNAANLNETRTLIAKARSLDPGNEKIDDVMSGFYFYKHDLPQARRAAEAFLAARPRNVRAIERLADILYYEAKPEQARPLFRQVLDADPRHPNDQTLNFLASTELMLGHYDAAIAYAEQGNAISEGDNDYALAAAYSAKGDLDKARAMIQKILRDEPTASLYKSKTLYNYGSSAYQTYLDQKYLPALRAAGLPEK